MGDAYEKTPQIGGLVAGMNGALVILQVIFS
jgi:hypothetical protein